MSNIAYVILITTIAGVGGTGIGGILGAIFKKDSSKVVSLLLSFAGGVMLSIVCFDLLPESITSAKDGVGNLGGALATAVCGVLAGYGIVFLLNAIIDKTTNKEVSHVNSEHPKTADSLDELIHSDHLKEHQSAGSTRSQLFIAGIVMACAIALHNIPEGMVIGASSISSGGTLNGILIAIIIGVHNIPEGMAVSVPLISGGMKKFQSILITAATGIPTVIGAILGFYIGGASPIGLAISLALASGAMLYVVLGELLPEAFLMFKSKLPALFVLFGVMLGLILVNI